MPSLRSAAVGAVLSLVLLGCPRPLPDTPAPDDLAALEARLTTEPVVTFQVGLRSRTSPGLDLAVRLGPGNRVEIRSEGDLDGVPAFSGRLGDGARGDTRRRVVQHLLRRGAADLLTTLSDGDPLPAPPDVPGLRTGGWETIDGGDARGLLFPGDGQETFLWLDDASGLPLRRDTQRLREGIPPTPTEVYTDWAFPG